MQRATAPKRSGLTLVELLIVMAIILLVSVATIPVALNIFGDQEISGAASTVQAMFTLTRDTAVRNGRPVGLRLVPDPDLAGNLSGGDYRMAANRILELQVPPDYTQGRAGKLVHAPANLAQASNPAFLFTRGVTWQVVGGFLVRRIAVVESKLEGETDFTLPPPPPTPTDLTSWFGNIRQGERIRFDATRQEYIVAGPFFKGVAPNGSASFGFLNGERFVYGPPLSYSAGLYTGPAPWPTSLPFPASLPNNFREYLFVVNGRDDDGDGYVDEQFDGLDNNNDGLIDPGYNGLDDDGINGIDDMGELILYRDPSSGNFIYDPALAEYEEEAFLGAPINDVLYASTYAITRRPLPAPDSREIQLPGDTVIDLTTAIFPLFGYGASERSIVPIDPLTGFVEFLIYPNGQIAPASHTGNFAYLNDFPAYYLWIAERQDVRDLLWGTDNLGRPLPNPAASNPPATRFTYRLPMTRDTRGYLDHDRNGVIDTAPAAVAQQAGNYLEGNRRLVVISPNSGKASVVSFTIDDAQTFGSTYRDANRQQPGMGN